MLMNWEWRGSQQFECTFKSLNKFKHPEHRLKYTILKRKPKPTKGCSVAATAAAAAADDEAIPKDSVRTAQ